MADRSVRFLPSFFDDLDDQLGPVRGTDGTLSATDVLLHELPRLRDRLAQDCFANTMAAPGSTLTRVLVAFGVLGRTVALYAHVAADDAVEVIGLDVAGLDTAGRRRVKHGSAGIGSVP